MSDTSFDVVVVGGGPGGYVAAIRAAQLGLKTAVVEREHLGGICLNWGCIPTKALLRSADVYRTFQHAKDYGLAVQGATFDLQAIVKRSRGVASQLSSGVKHLLKKNKVHVFDGFGRLAGKGKVSVESNGKVIASLSAPHIILATGARARTLPGLEPDGKIVWTYKNALVPDTMPKSLLVVGSGAIGIEFASFFNAFGADVTVVEVMDRIVPAEDAEISGLLQKSLEKQGMKIMTKASVKGIKTSATNAVVTVEKDGKSQNLVVDRVILAVGIQANIENIGLEGTAVKVERGIVQVDEWCRTGEAGVYAIGDITPGPWLAHKASHEGIVCVEKIAGVKDVHPINRSTIPGCTYCHPQVASVGLTEAKAKEAGHEVKVGRFPFVGNGKAIAMGEPEGLVKTVFDAKTGELLGAHMIGAEVTEMIQGFGIAKTLETTEADLMHTVFPHPTLSEMMHESVLDAWGRAIHF
ncbi:dihydrolipoyl dehydrogenase [Haematospirillum jordaniae]|uniref:Dihydrolipoyl dehydrogenase n=1 Tax=Haematospirillum jordaniae TaxID=1549855 RepID=A0A143DEF1_9PROT|nr:dihydrolipoyl dehydrogenase [Haematospirillum jordaniae]AMW35142.1 dihydrolipoamide dehydrogenase [Haematospirillum jordaniae]NKD46095.1 dihydrolipoyl dehydrogenase [Haematospirillum jordaniae]NKD56473.1 dihydrolipoyl dehydrogenase [Haematospirillum jordaniae]NKD58531.1 dihydrolipoyl dehydrogenase [Haematospirillum jordaniae]NKD66300.1 dihydrolipoyl dehydrogenase [Haematospirillum jordaniae]